MLDDSDDVLGSTVVPGNLHDLLLRKAEVAERVVVLRDPFEVLGAAVVRCDLHDLGDCEAFVVVPRQVLDHPHQVQPCSPIIGVAMSNFPLPRSFYSFWYGRTPGSKQHASITKTCGRKRCNNAPPHRRRFWTRRG